MEKSGDTFIDRNKVRILVCDNDEKSCHEVFMLLCKCSYQVTTVRSPRQVIDALNAEGPDIDIILSEVDLPMSKGLKMLKYIMRDKGLRRIPVIMVSAQDEVSLVVKCLKLGAADYLVKPLRTNELLNLWTHMWRRRRMLGLAEKNIVSYDLDLVASDPSDANTNSTTLFSDDTDDKSRRSTNPEIRASTGQEKESNAAPVEMISNGVPEEYHSNTALTAPQRETISPFSKKSELKIGRSSAFFTYVKSSASKINNLAPQLQEATPQHEKFVVNSLKLTGNGGAVSQADENPSVHTTTRNSSFSLERSCTPPISLDVSWDSDEIAHIHSHSRNRSPNGVNGCYTHTTPPPYPYYLPGVMNQVTMHQSSIYHKNNLSEMHSNSSIVPQYAHIPQCPPPPPQIPNITSYPYYQFGLCMQQGQIPMPPNPWPSFGNSSSIEVNLGNKIDRREYALMKFRQKRKERCFDKKIRYVNRKKLAERRPRLRGQFVRKVNGISVDLNGQPASVEDDADEDEEYDEDDPSNMDSNEDDDASLCP